MCYNGVSHISNIFCLSPSNHLWLCVHCLALDWPLSIPPPSLVGSCGLLFSGPRAYLCVSRSGRGFSLIYCFIAKSFLQLVDRQSYSNRSRGSTCDRFQCVLLSHSVTGYAELQTRSAYHLSPLSPVGFFNRARRLLPS